MLDWLYGEILGLISGLRDLATNLYSAISGVWSAFTATLKRWIAALRYVINGLRWMEQSALALIKAIFQTAYWVAFVYIGRLIAGNTVVVKTWATQQIGQAGDRITVYINQQITTVNVRITNVTNTINNTIKQVRVELGATSDLLARVAALVFHFLLNPEILAAWLAGAMLRALWAYLKSNAVAFGRMFLTGAVGIVMSSLVTIEKLIVEIFI